MTTNNNQPENPTFTKGQFGRVITAMLMQKDLYTLEEAQAECDRLNRKGQEND